MWEIVKHSLLPVTALFALTCTNPALSKESGSTDAAGHVLNCLKPFGNHFYLRTFTCPIGGETFQSVALGSYTGFGWYLDWKPASYIDFPPPLPVCPSNGFIIAKEAYSKEELAAIAKVIRSDEYRKLFSERHASYYLFAELIRMLGKEKPPRWQNLLQATWEAASCKDFIKYRRYALETIDAAEKQMAKISAPNDDSWQLSVIIANLYRRIGQFAPAREWSVKLDDSAFTFATDNSHYRSFRHLAVHVLQQAIADKNTGPVQVK